MLKFKKVIQIFLALSIVIVLFNPYITTAIQFFDGSRCDGLCADIAEDVGKILGILTVMAILSLTVNLLNRYQNKPVVRNISNLTEKLVSIGNSKRFIVFLLCIIGIMAVALMMIFPR